MQQTVRSPHEFLVKTPLETVVAKGQDSMRGTVPEIAHRNDFVQCDREASGVHDCFKNQGSTKFQLSDSCFVFLPAERCPDAICGLSTHERTIDGAHERPIAPLFEPTERRARSEINQLQMMFW